MVEVLGSGFERPSNKVYQMLRHPRILKVHSDRTWHDACTIDELQTLAKEANAAPEEGESQEMSQLVKKMQGNFHRKARREHTAYAHVTDRSNYRHSECSIESAHDGDSHVRTTAQTKSNPIEAIACPH